MHWTLLRNCIFTTAVLFLPGCLLVNAALTGLGLIGTGGLEYAGTVYSVAEYTYEYAVNDKTPDEVIEDKMAWLITPEEETSMTMTAQTSHSMANRPDLHLLASKRATPAVKGPRTDSTPAPSASAKHNTSLPKTVRAGTSPRLQPKMKTLNLATARTIENRPQHSYIKRDTDPLLVRLDRLELAFRQAELLAKNSAENGVKLSVQPDGRAPEDQGINGSWSIRHTIMQHGPVTAASAPADAGIS